jgi:hypothetical protein
LPPQDAFAQLLKKNRGNLPYSDLSGLPGFQSPEEKRAIESAIAPAGRLFISRAFALGEWSLSAPSPGD